MKLEMKMEMMDNITVDGMEIELMELIGSGAHGDVYEGVYEDHKFAVKIFLPEDDHTNVKYWNELRFAKLLTDLNPEIVTKYYGTIPNVIVYEKIDGINLIDISVEEKLEIGNRAFIELVTIFEWLHHNQIYHQDVTSGNIMYDGQFKIIDWARAWTVYPWPDRNSGRFRNSSEPNPLNHTSDDDLTFAHCLDLTSLGTVLFQFYNGYFIRSNDLKSNDLKSNEDSSEEIIFIEEEYMDVDSRIKESITLLLQSEYEWIDNWDRVLSIRDEIQAELE